MTVYYGQHAYALCDGKTDVGQCHAFVLPDFQRDPGGPGAVLAHKNAALEKAREDGWEIGGFDGPHHCPEHRTNRAPAVSGAQEGQETT